MDTDKHKYYDEISEGYDELHGEEQRRKIKIILENVSISKTDNILDIGGGTGILAEFFENVTCLEPSKKMLDLGLKKRKFIPKCARAEEIQGLFLEDEFDAIFSITAAHHFEREDEIINTMQKIVKNDGKIIITMLKKAKNTSQMITKLKQTFKEYKQIEEQTDIILIMANNKH